MLTSPCVRGCGTRTPGGTYLCIGQSPYGSPIENFIIDPPKKLPYDWQRGYALIKDQNGVTHVIIFVGESFYGSPWDFVEEARRFGISRKVPNNFPFDKLTPGQSRMIFAHRRVFPQFSFNIKRKIVCKFPHLQPGIHEDGNFCTFAHRDLAFVLSHNVIEAGSKFLVEMPSFEYEGLIPEIPGSDNWWTPGIFMAIPISHIEYPKVPNPTSYKNARNAGYNTFMTEW